MTDKQNEESPTEVGSVEERCGVDMPRNGEGNFCPCQLPPGHEGAHVYKTLAWPQGSNDPGSIWGIKR